MTLSFDNVLARGLVVLFWISTICAQKLPGTSDDLSGVSLEDLMNIQVTSVSKKEEALSKAGAAIFVITAEDIRRSGARNIPDLLRTVPGVDVAQIDASTQAISIRGFNNRLADKVLVLIDGRTVYTPTTSGVYWDQLDVPMEDIDRIEVIRGPGGTIWGANAVNGVINIMTKHSRDTKGLVVRTDGGSQSAAAGFVQYGGGIGSAGDYRVFEDYANTGNLVSSDGKTPAADGWHLSHSGFRADLAPSHHDAVTVQGDLMQTGEGQTISVVSADALPLMRTFNDSITVGEGNLLGRWDHRLDSGSDTSLQVYFDRYNRHDEGVGEVLNTVDIDFQHHVRIGSRNDVVWGGDYRFTRDSHTPGYGKTYVPLNLDNSLFSTFFQDEIAVTESLSFTIGSKFEHQPYSGFTLAPSAQLVWTPTTRQTLWLSASQASKEVSREEASLVVYPFTFPLPGGGFGVEQISGVPNAAAERLRDFEAGYRAQATKRLSVDLSAFDSYYHDLQTADAGEPFFATNQGPPHLVLPFSFGNSANGRTYGAEISANWTVTPWWRLSTGYSAIHLQVIDHPGYHDPDQPERADNTPENQIQVHSRINLLRNIEWDTAAYYVGHLRDGGNGPVAAYTRLDTRVGWRAPRRSVEIALVGQNLLTPRHAEFHNSYEVTRTLVERSVFGKITWRF